MEFVWYGIAGVLGGIFGGMGMGGGTVLIPLLGIFYNVNQKSTDFHRCSFIIFLRIKQEDYFLFPYQRNALPYSQM